jgi:hypothetical protein
VAVPVFSLRSRRGVGCGEFEDLRALVDWAAGAGLRLVQVTRGAGPSAQLCCFCAGPGCRPLLL